MYKFIILMLLSFNLYAQQSVSVEYGVFTTHLDDNYDYNNDNKMVAIEYNINNWYFNVSTFDNSFYKRSYTVGSGYKFYSIYNFNFDVLWGISTGYHATPARLPIFGKIALYVAPRVTYDLDLTDNVAVTPSVKMLGSAVEIGVGAKYKF